MFSCTPRPLYLRGNRPRYPLNRRLGGPQSRHELCEIERKRTPAVQPVARRYTDSAVLAHLHLPSIYQIMKEELQGKILLMRLSNKYYNQGNSCAYA
jgi:hypothetical protein